MKLSRDELNFQENLGLEDDLDRLNMKESIEDGYNSQKDSGESSGFGMFGGNRKKSEYDSPEMKDATGAFKNLKWKVNYLVGRDGKTPCLTHRFIFNQNTVILNLYHPDVKELVKLSGKAPKLTGHWAVAMCLTDDSRILSFLSSESREDLLLADAMIKVNASNESKATFKENEFNKMRKSMRDLLRNAGFNFGLN